MHKIRFEFMTAVNNEFMTKVESFMNSEPNNLSIDTQTDDTDNSEIYKDGNNISTFDGFIKCRYIQDFTQAHDKFSAGNTLNNVFIRTVDEMFEDDIITAEDDERNIIVFEICYPNNAGCEDETLTCISRDILHKHFKGCPDYIDSHVIVFAEEFSDPTDVNSCTECGVNIDIPSCDEPLAILSRLLNAFKEIVTCPAYIGMLDAEYIEPVSIISELVKLRQTMKQTFFSIKDGDKDDCLKEYYNVITELKKIINVHYGENKIIKEDK